MSFNLSINFKRSLFSKVTRFKVNRAKFFTPLLVLLLFSLCNFSLAENSIADNVPHRELLDNREKKIIESFKEANISRLLLAVPHMESRTVPTEEDFQRDACVYHPGKELQDQILQIIKSADLLTYRKALSWRGAIVGIYYSDLNNVSHSIRFDQDYPNQERVNGFYDDQAMTVKSSVIQDVYRSVAKSGIITPCDFFIKSYRG